MNRIRSVSCPTCKKIFDFHQSDFRPFCSEHCRMVDLGHWLMETHRIPSKERVEEYDEEKSYPEQ